MATTVERSATALKVFKNILSELRKADKSFNRNSDQYKYIIDQMRNNQVTQRQYSKSATETEGVAKHYLTYLTATRHLNELQGLYNCGEKSVEESARLVGLALPKCFS